MPTLWDAFLEDYANEVFDWTLRFTLEAFWHYCQDGNKGVHKLQCHGCDECGTNTA